MKGTILLPCFLFLLVSTGKAQQKIVHILDKHDRISRTAYPDSLTFKRSYDKVGNPISDETINPCYDRPNPVIIASGSLAICQGDSVILTAPPSIGYKWSTLDTSRSITVKQAGTYSVTTFNTLNCFKTSEPVVVKVNPLPQPSIIPNGPTIFCPGSSVVLSSSLTGTYLWSNGLKTKSITADSAKTYSLFFTDSNGCSATASQLISHYPKPVAGFTIPKDSQCVNGNIYKPINTTTLSSGTNTYLWKYDDNSTDTSFNPTKTYTGYGIFKIKLVATSNQNCQDSIEKLVTVFASPKTSFNVNLDSQCRNEHSFNFINNSSIGSGTMSHRWSHGDATFKDSIHSTGKTYTASFGTYSVKLVSTSNQGCKDSAIKTVRVYASPKASFNINQDSQCFSGHKFNYINTSSIGQDSSTYSWNLGEGSNPSTKDVTGKTYSKFGKYGVKLIAISTFGCKDSITKEIVIHPQNNIYFTVDNNAQCNGNDLFGFEDSSILVAGTYTREWDFGDTSFSTNKSPKHSFTYHGTHDVKLKTVTDKNCVDSLIRPVFVHPQPVIRDSMNFFASCLDANLFFVFERSIVDTGYISKTTWNFGDSTSSNVPDTSHKFNYAKDHYVNHLVETDKGCIESRAIKLTVHPQSTVDFEIDTPIQCRNGNSFDLKDKSGIDTGSYRTNWDLGDNNTDTSRDIKAKHYANPQIYFVKLVLTSNQGCKDSIIKTIVVNPNPVAKFGISDSTLCFRDNRIVTSDSSTLSQGSKKYFWDFGDTRVSTDTNPTISYTTYGTYKIELVVVSDSGCRDSSFRMIRVNPQANVKDSLNYKDHCNYQNKFEFFEKTTVEGGNLAKTTWLFGDTTSSNIPDTAHRYKYAKEYTVWHIIETDNGCIDSDSIKIIVHPQSVVRDSLNYLSNCNANDAFKFFEKSTVQTGSIFKTTRKFGDGYFSTSRDTSHSYLLAGDYSVTHITETDKGCIDSFIYKLTVHPEPIVSFTTDSSTQCMNVNSFNFINTSSIPTGSFFNNWYLGDNSIDTSKNITAKHYSSPNSYSVKLVLTSSFGCKDSLSKTVIVNPSPNAGFIISGPMCFTGNLFSFNNTSTIVPPRALTYYWSFGDNTFSSTKTPTKSYNNLNNYQVKLVVTSDQGCKDSTVKVAVINKQPGAEFVVDSLAQCLNNNLFSFADISSDQSVGIQNQWTMDTDTIYLKHNVGHSFKTPGNKNVTLTRTNSYNCSDAVMHSVFVKPSPAKPTIVRNMNRLESSTEHEYRWFWNDLLDDTARSRFFEPQKSGKFRVVVNNSYGCPDTSDIFDFVSGPVGEMCLQLAPNPNQGTFKVSTCKEYPISKYQIYDENGKELSSRSEIMSMNIWLIHLSVAPATYLIRVWSGDESETLKFVYNNE